VYGISIAGKKDFVKGSHFEGLVGPWKISNGKFSGGRNCSGNYSGIGGLRL
jgi:hypothetical protein